MLSARSVNAFLGIWLMLSVGVWPHEPAQHTNALITGGLVTAIAFVSVAVSWVRWINAALGAWLVASIGVLHTTRPDTLWNVLLVGLGVVAVALVPNELPPHFLDEKEA
jgi:hypothetical protein